MSRLPFFILSFKIISPLPNHRFEELRLRRILLGSLILDEVFTPPTTLARGIRQARSGIIDSKRVAFR